MHVTMKKHIPLLFPVFALFSCTAHHMATADKAYDRMAYAKATSSYEKAMRKSSDRDAALRMADACHRQNRSNDAAKWYAFAARTAPLNEQQALAYGQVLMSMDRHDLAFAQLELVAIARPDDPMVANYLQSLRERQAYFSDSSLYTVRLVDLPGMQGAFGAVIYRNGIVFAGERTAAGAQTNPWNGNSFLDLYSATRTPTGSWSSPVALPGDVNGRFHDGPAVFSADGRTMYFTRSDYYKFRLNKDGGSVSHLKLFRAELDANGQWGNIHQFAHNGEEFSTGHAALSADGNTMYFTSDRPGGQGGTDIYRSRRGDDGWEFPENLGAAINTGGNEMFPTIFGDTLYFSSNGHGGLGGLDIFRTWEENGEWRKPGNMGHPLNSPSDDLALVFEKDGRSGFLSSDRSGRDRIHSFTVNDPVLLLSGICINEITGAPMAGVQVKLIETSTGGEVVLTSGNDGRFQADLRPGQDLHIQGSLEGMFTESVDVSTVGQRTSRTYEVELRLKPLEMDKPFLVNNIYYDYDRWEIRPDAAAELKKLARLFKDNPTLHFELSSHTDSRAGDMYNMVLSEARARSAVDFLIRQGVDPERLVAKGYGESKLVNHCRNGVICSEELHQQNRRTEFKVIRPEMVVK
jgi:peptidoglycan-associated lipoprotein